MGHKNIEKKGLLILSILLTVLFIQPMKVHAYADLHKEKRHDVEKSRDKGDDHGHDSGKRDEHQDQRQDQHQDQHQDEHQDQH